MKIKQDKDQNKNEIFITSLISSGYKILSNSYENGYHELLIEKNSEIRIKYMIKNIVKSGWENKPLIRRIQITKIESKDLLISNNKQTTFLIGILPVIDKNIFVIWNVYKNNNHNTNKSCYVNLQTIFRTYLEGYVSCMESDQMIWASDENNLGKAIYNYMLYNNTTLGE